jgi:hypothetical protein
MGSGRRGSAATLQRALSPSTAPLLLSSVVPATQKESTALHKAVETNQSHIVKALLAVGADPNWDPVSGGVRFAHLRAPW